MPLIETIQRVLSRASKAAEKGPSESGSDKRALKRVPQRMRTGFVWNEKLITARPCMFKDLSLKGARIEVLGEPIKPALLADGFRLYFDTEKHEIPCAVAWAKGRMLGVEFEGKARPPSRKYG
jgi:hypothetical protein